MIQRLRFERSGFPLALCALAFLSWGPLLFNTDGLYWDDWFLNAQPVEEVARLMLSFGALPSAVLHPILLSFGNGVFGYRVVCFAATSAIALAIFGILVRLRGVGRTDAFLIAALALVFPVNQARISLINVPAQVNFALFMCAWYLSLRNLENRVFWKRALSLVFFYISFSTQSLLLFYVLPIAHLFWIEVGKTPVIPRTLWQKSFRWMRSNMDFLLVPFAYYLTKTILYSPPSSYDGYNAVTSDGLYAGVWKSVASLLPAFVDPMVASSPSFIIAGLFGGGALVLLLSGYFKSEASDGSTKRRLMIVLVGLAVFLIGVYPYCVVDKIPSSGVWSSRHQLLVPFGAAILLFGLIEVLSFGKRYLVLPIAAYFILTFAWADLRMLHDYRLDWKKQLSIIDSLKALEPARDARGGALFFVDNAPELNASERTFRFYELSGFLRRAYGDQTRFGALISDCQSRSRYKQFVGAGYNIDGYEGGVVAGVIRIDLSESAQGLAEADPGLVRLHFIPADAAEIPTECR